MAKKLIILRSQEDVARERADEVIARTESTFFSDPNSRPLLMPMSDGYFCFSEGDVRAINRRLNLQPNLFGVNFNVSVVPSSSDIGGYDNYIRIEARRAA